jgi:coenzyme F420-reducing hydrogenase delta subunit/ferredoxin
LAISGTETSSQECELAVRIDQDACSRCAVCISTCPYEAIEGKFTQNKLEEVKINPDKCQACGICTSSCPSSAIKTVYYESGILMHHVSQLSVGKAQFNLVIACKGSGPSADEIKKLSQVRMLDDYLTLRVPCLGRVSPESILQIVTSNVKHIVLVPCEEDLCKYKEGSKKLHYRYFLLKTLLNDLGYESNLLTLEENSVKAEIDQSNCVSCMNCWYACKYSAIKLNGKDTPSVDPDKCVGCGVCVGLCPAITIKMKGYDSRQIEDTIVSISKSIHPTIEAKKYTNILVMYCQWCNFPKLSNNTDNIVTENTDDSNNITYLPLPCLGRMDSMHIVQALYSGFDAVLAIGCRKDSCKMDKIKGNEVAEARINNLKVILKQLSIDSKLAVDFVRPEYVDDFSGSVNSFIKNLKISKEKGDN